MEMIDIYSKGAYPADVLSNFSPNEFVVDGIECASMEGFLQSLKYRSVTKQKKVCGLAGKAAKEAGAKKFWWKITGNLYWQGRRYKRSGDEFAALLSRAYHELLKNEAFYTALTSTKGKILTHSIGKHDKRKTVLTEEEFIDILNELRAAVLI